MFDHFLPGLMEAQSAELTARFTMAASPFQKQPHLHLPVRLRRASQFSLVSSDISLFPIPFFLLTKIVNLYTQHDAASI